MRNYQIVTKFTKEEYQKIINKAKEEGLQKSTFVRYALLKYIN